MINFTSISVQASHPEDKHAAGTAFLINSDGYMLTAEHVVSECINITVVNDSGALGCRCITGNRLTLRLYIIQQTHKVRLIFAAVLAKLFIGLEVRQS